MASAQKPLRSGTSWALDVEAGFGYHYEGREGTDWLLGTRGGVMYFREPYFFSTGGGVTWTPPTKLLTFSAYAEVIHLWNGLWGNVSVGVDLEPRPVLSATVGWSVLGVQGRYHIGVDGPPIYGVFGLVRVPIGVMMLVFD